MVLVFFFFLKTNCIICTVDIQKNKKRLLKTSKNWTRPPLQHDPPGTHQWCFHIGIDKCQRMKYLAWVECSNQCRFGDRGATQKSRYPKNHRWQRTTNWCIVNTKCGKNWPKIQPFLLFRNMHNMWVHNSNVICNDPVCQHQHRKPVGFTYHPLVFDKIFHIWQIFSLGAMQRSWYVLLWNMKHRCEQFRDFKMRYIQINKCTRVYTWPPVLAFFIFYNDVFLLFKLLLYIHVHPLCIFIQFRFKNVYNKGYTCTTPGTHTPCGTFCAFDYL